jgi:hypothetical protein
MQRMGKGSARMIQLKHSTCWTASSSSVPSAIFYDGKFMNTNQQRVLFAAKTPVFQLSEGTCYI